MKTWENYKVDSINRLLDEHTFRAFPRKKQRY